MADEAEPKTGPKTEPEYDLVVVGGGINGVGIARDAAGRGLRVLLCEQGDLASGTSSASSKLIHGGLRYLEQYEFRLVAKALGEREVLLRNAPHLVRPLRFVMPHVAGLRPRWMMRIGLFLYDHLDMRRHKRLPGSKAIRLSEHDAGAPLRSEFRDGYEYSDAWVDDARLVVLTALDAAERGATILTRTRCVGATRDEESWCVDLEAAEGRSSVRALALVNAAGPWVGEFLELIGRGGERRVRRVKGSHIVVRRLFEHGYGYIFQNPDRRVVFALPFEEEFTLIGTTEVEFDGDPSEATIDEAEIEYLCETANRFFERVTTPSDVVHAFSGVRPLLEEEEANPSAVTRDYQLDLDEDGAPLLSVFGGKITTYRKLAEEALGKLGAQLGGGQPWTEDAPLPGGDIERGELGVVSQHLIQRYPWLDESLRRRLVRAYGTRAERVLGEAASITDLGEDFGGGLFERELRYLVTVEWARTAEDVLWRRSQLGLQLSDAQQRRVGDWIEQWQASEVATPR
ncbi:MAG: glycerol-3-phosphate dehydrogenase [Dehalococcoidia bacterium]|jgi:glycerol-3-phosphate dehydrogenase|nr:glycerol-3-phosphate dehydrogenase [Dehalococcoidia bacterium]